MSHQTGIKSNNHLRQIMAESKFMGNDTRLFKVVINTDTEELELGDGNAVNKVNGNWEADFQLYVRKVVNPNEPCYIFFRMDSTNEAGHNDWAFILYSPEYSNVRKKMLYASTKSTLKKEFGTGIAYDYFAGDDDALTIGSFQSWVEEKQANLSKDADHDDPDVDIGIAAGIVSGGQLLTATEEERSKVRKMEYEMSLERNEKKSSQFQFPLRPEAINALLDFRDGRVAYLKLKVNLACEEIQLDSKVTANQLPSLATVWDVQSDEHQKKRLLPSQAPDTEQVDDGNIGFHVLSFVHLDPEGNRVQKTLFIFVMPTEKTTVRQRIAYSACLNSLIDSITNRINMPIDKRIEVDNSNDVTVSHVASKLYPELDKVKAIESNDTGTTAPKFTKPRGPPGRGPRRIIK